MISSLSFAPLLLHCSNFRPGILGCDLQKGSTLIFILPTSLLLLQGNQNCGVGRNSLPECARSQDYNTFLAFNVAREMFLVGAKGYSLYLKEILCVCLRERRASHRTGRALSMVLLRPASLSLYTVHYNGISPLSPSSPLSP